MEQEIKARIQPSRLEGLDALQLEATLGRQLAPAEAALSPDLSDRLPQGAQIPLLLLIPRNGKPPKLRADDCLRGYYNIYDLTTLGLDA